MDEEMKSIFDKISKFLKRREKQEACREAPGKYPTESFHSPQFDVGSMKKKEDYQRTVSGHGPQAEYG